MHTGDKQQIEALKEVYNMLLRKKDKYVEDTLTKELTPREYYHLDVGFRLLTLELKMVHSKIHYLEFGGELSAEQDPKPLSFYLKIHSSVKVDDSAYYDLLSDRTRLAAECDDLNGTIHKLQLKIRSLHNRIYKRAPNGYNQWSIPGQILLTKEVEQKVI